MVVLEQEYLGLFRVNLRFVLTNLSGRNRQDTLAAADGPDEVPFLTVEQLEEGIRMLDRGEIEPNLFWDQNVAAFRLTVLCAMNETSNALASRHISPALRDELEGQIEPLKFYLDIANSYLAARKGKMN